MGTGRKLLNSLVALALVAALATICAVPVSAGVMPTIRSKMAITAPTVDGLFGAGEWSDAAVVDLQAVDPNNEIECYLYVKNSGDRLFILFDIVGDTADTTGDSVCWSFGVLLGSAPSESMWGLGPSPNSATPHRIYEISWDLTFFGWGPGDTLNFAMGVEDGPTSTFSEWPIWADGVDVCWHDYGDLILASPPVPNVPALSLWGTVGMTGAMAAFVTWRLRRRTAAL